MIFGRVTIMIPQLNNYSIEFYPQNFELSLGVHSLWARKCEGLSAEVASAVHKPLRQAMLPAVIRSRTA